MKRFEVEREECKWHYGVSGACASCVRTPIEVNRISVWWVRLLNWIGGGCD